MQWESRQRSDQADLRKGDPFRKETLSLYGMRAAKPYSKQSSAFLPGHDMGHRVSAFSVSTGYDAAG